MNVGILTLAHKLGGGTYQYTISLIEALKNYSSGEINYIQIKNKNFPKMLDNCIEINCNQPKLSTKIKRLIHTFCDIKIGSLTEGYDHPDLEQISLIISPTITLIPYHLKKKYIVTIHDFQHVYYPKFFTLKERISRKIVYKTGQKATLIVCESNYVKQDIIKFLNVPSEKIEVIESPPPKHINIKLDDLSIIKNKYELPDKFIFYPAQFWLHKNHIKLIESLKFIKDKYGTTIPLILVGAKKNNFDNTMRKIAQLNLVNQVKYLGYISDEEMPYLYKLATALVMPTLFESVSMPIWEAFELGVPVVSSNVCALPQQVSDAGLLFDPNKVEDIAEKVYSIWIDLNLREELIKRGYAKIKNLTLENYAKKWEKIILKEMSR